MPRQTTGSFTSASHREIPPDGGSSTTPQDVSRFLKAILRLTAFVAAQSKGRIITFAVLVMAGVAALDILVGDASISILYLIPISLITWRLGRTAGVTLSIVSVVSWAILEARLDAQFHTAFLLWNAVVRLAFFLIITNVLSVLAVMEEWIHTDYLTGLANRRGFYEFAANEIQRAWRTGHSFTLAYLDVDDFKAVNDKRGHSAGDALLQLIGVTLRQAMRRSDVVARLGGDEFVILLADTSFESSVSAIEKVRARLNTAVNLQNWNVTFSIGVATFQNWNDSILAAIDEADSLMFKVKKAGKNGVRHGLAKDTVTSSSA